MSARLSDRLKNIFKDTAWSIAGLVLMNVAAQFAVYPCWNRVLGSEAYGNIVYLLAVMNIMAISLGSGVNYARMRRSADGSTANRPYLLLMAAGTLLSLLILLLLNALGLLHAERAELWLLCLLTAATTWRFYADVEYRLHINYKGYFLYYLVIGLGYLLGIGLFRATRFWPLALLPGELAGLALVLWRGSIFRRDRSARDEDWGPILRLVLLLVGSNALSHLIFNGDRLILRWFDGATAVSLYYIASLFGKTMTLITTPLNGVLVGYLAKYDGKLTKKLMDRISLASMAAIAAATLACLLASRILLPFLYPAEFSAVRPYLLLANAAQVIYFVGNVLVSSVLLRFTPARNQLTVNLAYGVLFAAVCIPLTRLYGIDGFCRGLLGVNVLRLGLCVILGYAEMKGKRNDDR